MYMKAHLAHALLFPSILQANVNAATINGDTVLMVASGTGRVEAVRSLLNARVDVNAKKSSGGWTALMAASDNGHEEVVKLLIEAKVHYLNPDKRTAEHY